MLTEYDKLLDLNVLYDAFQRCKKGVYWKCSVQKYESNLLLNLYRLKASLEAGTYRQLPFDEFDIVERGKKRHIKALDIQDRVLQRALCDQILTPLLVPYLIYDNGANVKGKGVDFAKKRMRDHLAHYYAVNHTNEGYILQMDISQYFDSIPHDKCKEIMCEHIDDYRVAELVRYLISTFSEGEVGIGIGSQLSQVIGIYYLHHLDDYIKIVKGMKYYARYTDDMYVIHKDKQVLVDLLAEIDKILAEHGLKLNKKKTHIRKLNRRFVFLKVRYELTDTGKVLMLPSKATFTRERHKLKAFKQMCKDNKMTLSQVADQYRGWRGTVKPSKRTEIKYLSYNAVKRMDEYYAELFSENINHTDKEERKEQNMEFEKATITFNDGSQLAVTINGTCYISETEPAFPSDLSNIHIETENHTQVIQNGRIVEVFPLSEGHWFAIEEIPEAERAATQVRADLDFIAMELDIEL